MCYMHNQWYDISCATLYYTKLILLATFTTEAQNTWKHGLLLCAYNNKCTLQNTCYSLQVQ